jgi:hypothetical protein
MSKKLLEPICKNCLLYNHEKKECKVAILINGEEQHLPVSPNDKCHMDELGIPVDQVRWWVENKEGKKIDGNGIVKIEYPENFFGNKE